MSRFIHLLVLVLLLPACTSMVPRKDLPFPLTNNTFGETVKVVTVPLPVIASSPNEGITAGALTAFLLHNREDEVSTLLAPQVNYNPNFGITTTLYGAFYPSSHQSWEVNLSQSTKVNNDYEVKFLDRTFLAKKLEMNGFLYYFNDGSARFFGFQSTSRTEDESNYDDREYGFTLSAGYQIAKHFQLVLGERFRKVDIETGAINSVLFIRDRFSTAAVPGIDGFSAHAQKIAIVYSTLDSAVMPTFGGYTKISMENSSRMFGSSADYRHYEAEMKGFIPLDKARFISVFRLAYNQTLGEHVPFLEQSILGGENTLRGYGRNRFIDNSYFLLNLEERIRLFRWEIFNVTADWEVAPFIDFGSVMETLDRASTRNFEFNPGLGVRAVVRPNIIGRVDVGFGKDGPAVFVGLGYPF
jgi:outer membrane protein assembly factor BamA